MQPFVNFLFFSVLMTKNLYYKNGILNLICIIFQGMPDEWKAILHSSNISKQEQKNNPQAVIDVLKWFESKANNKQESKYMTAVKPNSGK